MYMFIAYYYDKYICKMKGLYNNEITEFIYEDPPAVANEPLEYTVIPVPVDVEYRNNILGINIISDGQGNILMELHPNRTFRTADNIGCTRQTAKAWAWERFDHEARFYNLLTGKHEQMETVLFIDPLNQYLMGIPLDIRSTIVLHNTIGIDTIVYIIEHDSISTGLNLIWVNAELIPKLFTDVCYRMTQRERPHQFVISSESYNKVVRILEQHPEWNTMPV
jgi:hypothetical protein